MDNNRCLAVCLLVVTLNLFDTALAQHKDPRDLQNGYSIYDNGYIDQPYVVVLKDGRWLCVFTTGAGTESTPGQHIVSTVSADHGKTWTQPVSIEPGTGPSASWATPYITEFGRVYVFYDYNGDRVDSLDGKVITHNSEMGWYCYKYSDDNGLTWSKRYRLPLPKAPVDFNNDFKGEVQLFWGIDKPKQYGKDMIFAFTRLGKYIQSDGEGWFYKSDNIYEEKNPQKIHWQLLPDGDRGLRNPAYGSIQEEFNTVPLNNGDLYCMFRTTQGFSADAYSRDGGHTWTLPRAASNDADGRQLLKNPRACPRVFKTSNGNYLFWFHNRGEKSYRGRNPVWVSGGIEKGGIIQWSQPEILLYDIDTTVLGMSYPDLIEQNGKYWFTETQKTIARVHPVNVDLLKGMWNQSTAKKLVRKGLIYNHHFRSGSHTVAIGALPDLKKGGFTIDLWLELNDLEPGQILLDNRDGEGKGICIITTQQHTVKLELSDGQRTEGWDTDQGAIGTGTLHHMVFIIDGLPNIITIVVDGRLCDGGNTRLRGWGRFSETLKEVAGQRKWVLAPEMHGYIKNLRVYNRYLTTSEAIRNFHEGFKGNNKVESVPSETVIGLSAWRGNLIDFNVILFRYIQLIIW